MLLKKKASGVGVTLMKTKSSEAGAGAMFMKRRAPEPEQGHLHDGFSALLTAMVTIARYFYYDTVMP